MEIIDNKTHIENLEKAILEDEKTLLRQIEHEKFLATLQGQEKIIEEYIVKAETDLKEKKDRLVELQKEIVAAADFQYDVSDPMTIKIAKETLEKLKNPKEDEQTENNT